MNDDLARELIDAVKQANERLAAVAQVLEEMLGSISSDIAKTNHGEEIVNALKAIAKKK